MVNLHINQLVNGFKSNYQLTKPNTHHLMKCLYNVDLTKLICPKSKLTKQNYENRLKLTQNLLRQSYAKHKYQT